MKKALIISLKIYAVLCTLLVTMMAGWLGYAHISRMLKTLHLPNGFVLAPGFPDMDRARIYITGPDGKLVVDSAVDDVMWCGDVVYGVRYFSKLGGMEECAPTHNLRVESRFIYEHSKKKLLEFELRVGCPSTHTIGPYEQINHEAYDRFDAELKRRNLPAFDRKKAVRYLDVVNGLTVLDKNEMCRK